MEAATPSIGTGALDGRAGVASDRRRRRETVDVIPVGHYRGAVTPFDDASGPDFGPGRRTTAADDGGARRRPRRPGRARGLPHPPRADRHQGHRRRLPRLRRGAPRRLGADAVRTCGSSSTRARPAGTSPRSTRTPTTTSAGTTPAATPTAWPRWPSATSRPAATAAGRHATTRNRKPRGRHRSEPTEGGAPNVRRQPSVRGDLWETYLSSSSRGGNRGPRPRRGPWRRACGTAGGRGS